MVQGERTLADTRGTVTEAVEAIRPRREVTLTARGRNVASEAMNGG